LTSPSSSSEESSSESSSEEEEDDDLAFFDISSSEDSLSLFEDSAFLVGAALAAFDGATSSEDESESFEDESESSEDDEGDFLEETASEGTAFADFGAAFSSDDESESEESEESEAAFLGAAGVFFGEGLVVATFSADLVAGVVSSSLSLESDDAEGGLAAFTWAALGFSSSEELSLLSSDDDGSFTFLAAWKADGDE
jgi:hypothetical protein